MTPAALLIAEALLKYGPGAARALATLFSKPEPTLADWEVVFKVTEKTYEDYTKSLT